MPSYNGIYRGKVVNNSDPTGQKRVQVMVPAISVGGSSSWAPLCGPFGGTATPPAVGSNVWVMFEAGDLNAPVVMGTLMGSG